MVQTITETDGEIKSLTRRVLANRDLFPAVLVLVVGVVSFGLGRLSVQPMRTVSDIQLLSSVGDAQNTGGGDVSPQHATTILAPGQETGEIGTGTQPPATSAEGRYVASKNGAKYHLPWCSGAARIAEENKIWFASKQEAEVAGYTPAANCKGI